MLLNDLHSEIYQNMVAYPRTYSSFLLRHD